MAGARAAGGAEGGGAYVPLDPSAPPAHGLVTRPSDGTAKPIDATLGGRRRGRYTSRGAARPHVVLNPFGMGVLDVALYGAIAARARHWGVGSLVDLG